MKRQRAPKGSISRTLVLRMDDATARSLTICAEADGVSESEWVRQAVRERALRVASRNPELKQAMLEGG